MRERTEITEKNVKDYFAKLIKIINISQKFSRNISIEENLHSIEALNQRLSENINPENLEKIFQEGRKLAIDSEMKLLNIMIDNLRNSEPVVGAKQAKPDSRIHEVLGLGFEALENAIKTESIPPEQSQLLINMISIQKNMEEDKGNKIYPLDKFENLINQYLQHYEKVYPSAKNKVAEKEETLKITLNPKNAVNEFKEIKKEELIRERTRDDSLIAKARVEKHKDEEELSKLKNELISLNSEYFKLQKEIKSSIQPITESKAQNQIINQVRLIQTAIPQNQSQYEKIVSGFERAVAPLKMKKINHTEEHRNAIAQKFVMLSQKVEAIEKERTLNLKELSKKEPKLEAEKLSIQKQKQITEDALTNLKEIFNNLTQIKDERFNKQDSIIDTLHERITDLGLTISKMKANKAYSGLKLASLENNLKNIALSFNQKIERFTRNISQENIETSDIKLRLDVIEGALSTVNNDFREKAVQLHYQLVTLKAEISNDNTQEHLAIASLQKRLGDLTTPETFNRPNYYELDADKIIKLGSDIQKAKKIKLIDNFLCELKKNHEKNMETLNDLVNLQKRLDPLYEKLSSDQLNNDDIENLRKDCEKLESKPIKIISTLLNKIDTEIHILSGINEDDLRINFLQTMYTKLNQNKNDYLNSVMKEEQFKTKLLSDLETEVSDDNLKELTYNAPDILMLGNFGRFLLEIFNAIAELFEDDQEPRAQLFSKPTETHVANAITNARRELESIKTVIIENMDNNNSNSSQPKSGL